MLPTGRYKIYTAFFETEKNLPNGKYKMKKNDKNSNEESTREKIFQSAVELFAEKGYKGVSVREICEKSGVSKPALYYYFKDKENLLFEMVKETESLTAELATKHMGEKKDFMSNLRGLVQFYKEFTSQYAGFARYLSFMQSSSIPDWIADYRKELQDERMKNFMYLINLGIQEGYIEEDVDKEMIALTIFSGAVMLIMKFIVSEYNPEKFNEQIERLYKYWVEHILIKK